MLAAQLGTCRVHIATLAVDAIVNPANTYPTPGFNLKAKYVIHAAGPRWQGGHRHEAEKLANTYRACMQLGEQLWLCQIAFPAISTEIYGYPLEEATRIAVSTVRGFVAGRQSLMERVIFACFDDATIDMYRRSGVAVEERLAY
jgi:O-acetyl-ADP-ribose deacetylase (regulator of RNase III)